MRISVLMSAHGEPAEWLSASIESILHQTMEDLELLVVNDNPSRPELAELLARYAADDGRVRVLANERNLGLTPSLNRAIRAAQGEFLARMDADDVSLPDRLRRQCDFLRAHPEVFLVGCSVRLMDRDGTPTGAAIKHQRHRDIVRDLLSGRLAFYHPAIMFRNDGTTYRERFRVAQDQDLYLTLLSRGVRFANLREVLLHYRVSGRNVSMTSRRGQLAMKRLAMEFYRQRERTGRDSYDEIDTDDLQAVCAFLGIDPARLDAEALREQTLLALASGDRPAARRLLAEYARCPAPAPERVALRLFVAAPLAYRAYRRLRYSVFAR